MLSIEGWINGITALCTVVFSIIFGLFLIYKARKQEAKLLAYWSLGGLLGGLGWLGPGLDFLTILITGKNMDNSYGQYGIISYMWIPLSLTLLLYVGAEFLIPNKKKIVLFIYIILGIIFELILFLDPMGSFTFDNPTPSGDNLIDARFTFGSPLFIIVLIFLLSVILLPGLGFIVKCIKSSGIIRKKFLLLAISINLVTFCIIFDGITTPGFALIFTRIGVLSGYWFLYFALREEHIKPGETIELKEFKREKSQITLIETLSEIRPTEISNEDISYSREHLTCLVCKNEMLRLTTLFICPKCKALYCEKCSNALIQSENACWVCNHPIDESKPINLYKKLKDREESPKSKR